MLLGTKSADEAVLVSTVFIPLRHLSRSACWIPLRSHGIDTAPFHMKRALWWVVGCVYLCVIGHKICWWSSTGVKGVHLIAPLSPVGWLNFLHPLGIVTALFHLNATLRWVLGCMHLCIIGHKICWQSRLGVKGVYLIASLSPVSLMNSPLLSRYCYRTFPQEQRIVMGSFVLSDAKSAGDTFAVKGVYVIVSLAPVSLFNSPPLSIY